MHISVLCNAGLAITSLGKTLLLDLPNEEYPPFYRLDDSQWAPILLRQKPYENVCGLYFTHTHPDHFDRGRVEAYCTKWPEIPCFLPEEHPEEGEFTAGPFKVNYRRFPHVPMKEQVPVHVVSWIETPEARIYVTSDANLEPEKHRNFLNGRYANAAFWNSMYLSKPDTRALLRETAQENFIYHMPKTRPDPNGLWRKCDNNFKRYGNDLGHVTVIDHYPMNLNFGVSEPTD